MRNIIPVLTVVGLLIVVWYGAAVALNAQWARDVAETRKASRLSLGMPWPVERHQLPPWQLESLEEEARSQGVEFSMYTYVYMCSSV